MKIEGSCVTFEPCDAAFVKKFGPLEAANMVLDYHSVHPNMPFLYDAEQLAGFFGISCGELNHIVNHIQKEYCVTKRMRRNVPTIHTSAHGVRSRRSVRTACRST